jgi:hypothetical protein
MSYQRHPHYWASAVEVHGNSITVCSCIPVGTKVEQNPTKREIMVMWIKDAAAGAGLVLFMVSSFLLASGAHIALGAALHHLPI